MKNAENVRNQIGILQETIQALLSTPEGSLSYKDFSRKATCRFVVTLLKEPDKAPDDFDKQKEIIKSSSTSYYSYFKDNSPLYLAHEDGNVAALAQHILEVL